MPCSLQSRKRPHPIPSNLDGYTLRQDWLANISALFTTTTSTALEQPSRGLPPCSCCNIVGLASYRLTAVFCLQAFVDNGRPPCCGLQSTCCPAGAYLTPGLVMTWHPWACRAGWQGVRHLGASHGGLKTCRHEQPVAASQGKQIAARLLYSLPVQTNVYLYTVKLLEIRNNDW